jgi:TP901 family phage tail tape measure protein
VNDLSLLIKAKLNIDESAQEINSKQISALQAKLEKLKLKIEIDDKVLKALKDFSSSIEKLNAVMEKQNETVKKNILISHELDGSTKTIVQDFKRNGEIIEQTTTKIQKQTDAFEKQKLAIDGVVRAEENLASHTRRLSDGVQTGTTDVYKLGHITETVNQPDGGIEKTKIKEDFERAVKLSKEKMDLLHKEALEMNRVYDASVKAFTDAEQRKRNEIKRTAEIDSQVNNQLLKEKYNNMLEEAYAMNKTFDENRRRTFNLGTDLTSKTSGFTGADKSSVEKYAKEIYGVNAEVTKFNQTMDKNGRVMAEATIRVNKNSREYVENKMKIDSATKSVNQFGEAVSKKTGKDMGVLGQFGVAMTRFPVWIAASTLFMGSLHAIRNSVQYVVQMDTALTNLSKVVDFSAEQLDNMKVSAIDLGKVLGKSSVDIMNSMAEFGRITKNQSEIIELTRVATMASNVTSMTAQEASKALTLTMVTFGLEAKDAMSILNSWNEIQNNFKVSAESLADSIGKVGAASKVAKTDIQTLEGVVTSIIQSTGISGMEAGTAVKSFISRIYRTDESDPEQLGKTAEALKNIADVSVQGAEGLKPFGQLLDEIAGKWQNMSEQDKMATAQSVGSTYHYSKFIALMENYSIAIDATNKAYDSQNSALDENQKYLASVEGRWQTFKTNLEELKIAVFNDNFLKNGIDILTEAIQNLNISLFGYQPTESSITRLKKDITDLENMTFLNSGGSWSFLFKTQELETKRKKLAELELQLQENKKAQEENNKKEEESNKLKKDNANLVESQVTSQEEFNKQLDAEYDNLNSLASAYQTLNTGETLSIKNLSELVSQYPTLAKYLNQTNDLTFKRGEILKQVWEIEKQTEIARLQSEREKINQALKSSYGQMSKKDYVAYMSGIDPTSVTNFKNQLDTIDALLKIYNTDISGFDTKKTTTPKQTNISDILKDEQKLQNEITKSENLSKNLLAEEYAIRLKNLDAEEKSQQELLKYYNLQMKEAKAKGLENELTEKILKTQGDLANIEKERKDINADIIKNAEELAKQKEEALKKETEAIQKLNDEKLKTYDESNKTIIDLLKDRYDEEEKLRSRNHEDTLQSLDDQLDSFKDYVDKQKDEIDRLYDTQDYQENVAESSKKILEFQSEIAKRQLAANSGDLIAQSEIKEFEEKLAEERKGLTKTQRDREKDLRKQNLDDTLSTFEKSIDAQKRTEDDSFESYKRNLEDRTTQTALELEAQKLLMTGTIVDVQNALVKLFTDVGANATITGQILQTQLISRLGQLRDINNNLPSITANSSNGITESDYRSRIGTNADYYDSMSGMTRAEWERRHGFKGIIGGDTGLYTGEWGSGGKLAVLHEKELLLNKIDTSNILKAVNLTRQLFSNISTPKMPNFTPIGAGGSVNPVFNIQVPIYGNADKSTVNDITTQVAKTIRIELNKSGIFRKS